MSKERAWIGSIPKKCDICHNDIDKFFYDGKTQVGPWAIMCPECFIGYGYGLGTGRGQMYTKIQDKYIKTGG